MNFSNIKRILFIFCILLLVGASSCKKFLATYSQNKSFVESADDLDEILVGEGYENYTDQAPGFLSVMDDDAAIGKPTGSLTSMQNTGFHFWQSNPRIDNLGKLYTQDPFFNRIYKHISRVNIVLHNVPLLLEKGEPADKLKRISGEAHYLRAHYYFMLVNVYGRPWHTSSAASDYGVPLKTETQVEDKFFSRSTVKQVYDQIVKDLLEAEKEMEGFNTTTSKRANLAAVQGLLSRVWLYQEEYEKVISYSGKLLNNERYKLSDLNNYVAGADFNSLSSPEIIFTMGTPIMSALMLISLEHPLLEYYHVSDDLAMLYTNEDLRLNAFYFRDAESHLRCVKSHNQSYTSTDVSDCWMIRLSECYLNRAEALAMLGRDQEAINIVQQLRKARFKPTDLTSISYTGESLVNFIRDERRRELAFEAHRWFDLRRYGANSKYPSGKTIRHYSIAYGANGFYQDGYYELKPYDQERAAYVVPIPRDEIEQNNGNLQNEDRPQRPLQH